jgi:type II secretory pathway pseudopilin PulG
MVRTNKKNRAVRAFSLIEAAIVLAIVGLVIGAIWVAAVTVQEKRQLNQMVEATLFMNDRITTLYKSNPPAADADITSFMIDADVVPKDLIQNGIATTPWGLPFTIETLSSGAVQIIWDADLTGAKCRQFSSQLFGALGHVSTFKTGIITFTVNGVAHIHSDSVLDVMNSCAAEGSPNAATTLQINF